MAGRLAVVDALRGFAAVWVFLYHLWNIYFPGCSAQDRPIPLDADTPAGVLATFPLFAYGYAGVGLFFVLSGFCIHLPQARRFHTRGTDGLDVRTFGRRRFRRLYPAFLASLFLACLGLGAMNWTWADPPGPDGVTGEYIVTAFGLSWVLPNAVFALPLTPAAHKLNPVVWTLLFELQFYLLYPLLLTTVRRVGFRWVGAVLLAAEVLCALVPLSDSLLWTKPHTEWLFPRRYFDWFLGVWLAERLAAGHPLPARWGRRLLALGLIGGPVASGFAMSWPLHELLFVVGAAGLVAWAVAKPAHGPNHLTRLFAPVGEWSYSLYLVHMPVMRLVFAGPVLVSGGWAFVLAGPVSLVLVPATAVLWYRLFEKPFLPTPGTPKPAHQPSFA